MKIVEERFAVHMDDFKHYDTEKLRKHFLVEKIFETDEVLFTYTHYERLMVGGAMPVNKVIKLDPVYQQKADFFLQRRELGAINIGGSGKITVDGTEYKINTKEALYIGRGAQDVSFSSDDASNPAKFYLNSTPAHHAYPTKKVGKEDAKVLNMGSSETCNERNIYQLMIAGVVDTCQLQMGMTELKSGSIWNTMPVPRLFGGTDVMSRSPKRMRPDVGAMKPAIIRNVVDFPHPDGPSRVKNSPEERERSMS